ncbi:MAG: hypothetical protein ABJ360_11980 [Roseobacter sp.]
MPEQSKETGIARVTVTQEFKVRGAKLLRAKDSVLDFNPAGLASAQETNYNEVGGSAAMILAALRVQLEQLQSEAIKRQLPEEVVSRLNSYAVPLSYDTPVLILLDGPMAFLKGGLNDPYTTDALDGGFIGGWQKLCGLHDQLANCLAPKDSEGDAELRLTEDFEIEEARDLTRQVLDAVDSPSVSKELITVLQATSDTVEKASERLNQRTGLVRRALTLIGAVTAFPATGAALHSWSASLEGRAVIDKLIPLAERFAALFTI